MDFYLEGVIKQQMARARALMTKIPRNLPMEFQLLVKTCRDLLNEYLAQLQHLYEHPEMLDPANQNSRVLFLRRITRDMNILETVAITALVRVDKDEDTTLNRLMEELCSAIRYPLLRPITTTLSSDYFHIFPTFNLIRVPLIEMKFFLHLPDLLHELAHPFFFDENHRDPLIQPIRNVLTIHLGEVSQYLQDFLLDKQAKHPHPSFQLMVQAWEESWVTYWGIEFICDLFAIYTVGPAFAWSHLYLVVKLGLGGQPYEVPEYAALSHPADDARLRPMLMGLKQLGFGQEANEIQSRWDALIDILGDQPNGYYEDCYPTPLLEQLTTQAFAAFKTMDCVHYAANGNDICQLLNEAWGEFLRDPTTYVDWEDPQITQLISRLNGTNRII